MNTEIESRSESVYIGAPVYHPAYDKRGHVVKMEAASGNSFTIGAGMQRDRFELVIVWDNLSMTEVSDGIARTWLDRAANYRLASIDEQEAAIRLSNATVKRANDRAAIARAQEDEHNARMAFEAESASKIPVWAKAVIVAELEEDTSDTMTDYFATKTTRTIILGFSKHTRDIFSELRKAALNHPETASLHDAPESAEHREKYSMGAGYYLKTSSRYSTGWTVRKRSLYAENPVRSLPFPAEWATVAPKPETPSASVSVAGIRIEEHTHTKKGFQMFICIMPERVDREEFDRLRDLASNLGGWYSKPWGKTPGGFAFKDRAAAETFANPEPSGNDDGPKPGAAMPAVADKLRGLADGLQRDIDSKLGDRLTNTPKRQREAATARMEGYRLQRTQQALNALADAHEAGTVPPELVGIRTKAAAYDLMGTVIDRSNAGYYDAGIDTGKPSVDSPASRALWAMIEGQSDADKEAEELRRKVQALQFAKIPGYFPTPRAVIDQMLDLADMPEGVFSMLEPEAGSGAILDAVREDYPDAELFAFERHNSLREILTLKGYELHGSDFMESVAEPIFDRVLMNPPFENGQDIDHVRHAFNHLRSGGKLVAVMSPGPFFRSDRKAREFREWFEERGGEKYDLPAGAFKESGTGTGTVLVVLDGDETLTSDGDNGKSDTNQTETQMAAPYRIGTAHFESEAAADRFYKPYGSSAAEKIADGEIYIGKPMTCEPDEIVTLDRSEGRYFIERRA